MESSSIVLQVGVKVLLKNPQGRYLVLMRNPEKYPEIGEKWDIPGGRIDVGISLFENLKREVREETQYELSDENQTRLIAAQDILKSDKHVVRLTYVAPISGDPILSDEHIRFAWHTREELAEMGNLDSYVLNILPLL